MKRIGLIVLLGFGGCFATAVVASVFTGGGTATVPAAAPALPAAPARAPAAAKSNEAVPTADAPGAPSAAPASTKTSARTVWDDPASVRFAGTSCPRDLWSVIKGFTPANDEFEARRHEDERGALAAGIRETTYLVALSSSALELGEYDFKKEAFPITIDGSVNCQLFALALGTPKILKVAEEVIGQRYVTHQWDASSLSVLVPVPEAEAEKFKKKALGGFLSGAALDAEVAFRVMGGRVDRKHNKLIDDDVGAGPIVLTKVIGIRVLAKGDVVVDTAPALQTR